MTTVITHPGVAIAERVAETIDGIFATIDGWRDIVESRLAEGLPLTAEAVDPVVASFAVPALTGDALITGSGFVASPGALTDAAWHLAWWLRGTGEPTRLATIDDPSHEQFRDYTALEWWRVPARTGARHLTGPYVDYVCTDDYTVTITTPVRVGGAMVGIVGADALVDRLERELLPVLRAAGPDTALVNASARVVTATDAGREPGSILRLEGLADALASRPAGNGSTPLESIDASVPRRAAAGTVIALPGGATVVTCGDTSLSLVIQDPQASAR
ncbi:hypothetical protein G5T42_05765 [Microbacterium sp. 4R-513]|uniref:cache domain-containing protein n=1 Tax=Microbacterium sp. 4R-513 TaxID=2567934 RepID=UPI0013E1E93D|nr:cache domain-containing protein [Microbacterium sp. 4R-513]QIG39056.1 hypothetical protein G5T42_05765 [Microbacterium sp. 4R-513]